MSEKQNDRIFLRPNDYSDISFTDLCLLAQTQKFNWAVIQPLNPTYTSLTSMVPEEYQKVFIQTGFICKGKDVQWHNTTTTKIQMTTHASPLSDDIFNKYSDSFESFFIEAWKDFFSEEMCNWFRNSIQQLRNVTSCNLYYNEFELGGLHAEFPHRDSFDLPIIQIGWIWINNQLLTEQRLGIKQRFAEALMSRPDVRFQAGIHILNVRSQKFFRKLGFEPLCAHVYLPSLS